MRLKICNELISTWNTAEQALQALLRQKAVVFPNESGNYDLEIVEI